MTRYLRLPKLADDDLASVVDELSLWSARFGTLLLENLELRPNMDVLDVGCGCGFPLFELAHRLGKSCRLTGVDVWPAAIERARFKLRVYGLENVRILEQDAAHLPFGAEEFDLIVSNVGINNFEEPERVLAECFRVARSGARIVLTTNPEGHMSELYEVYRQVLIDLNLYDRLDALDAEIRHRRSPESIRSMLEAAGFEMNRLIEDRFTLRYLDGSAFFHHSLTRIGFLEGWRRVVEPQSEEAVFAEIEARLNRKAAAEQGELRMTVPMAFLEAVKRG